MTQKYGTNVYAPVVAGADTDDDMAVAYGDELGRSIHHFDTQLERDNFTQDFKSRLYKSWCVVKSDSAWYEWTGTQEDGSDGDWHEIDLGGGGGIAGIDVAQVNGQSNQVTAIDVYAPLETYADPDKQGTARLLIKPNAYEPMHKPSFLAYLAETEEVVGKIPTGLAKSHHDGALWFDDIVWPNGAYIDADKDNKAYGIQEADELDPNVSGGTDYLIAFRVAMKGKAPNNGIVRAYLYNKSVNPFSETGYLKDVNGALMAFEKHYKVGDELGVIDVVGVVNAKGLQEFTCHVMDDFADDQLNLEDRTEGGTCLMIQALTSNSKTGNGLQQFEIDTQQNIEFSSHYLGVDRMNLGWVVKNDIAETTGNAGTGQTLADGFHFYNLTKMSIAVQNGYLLLKDDGVDTADFSFGKVFSAEETQMLRGKDIEVTTTLIDKDSGFRVALMKWTGKPDEYTQEIFETRVNGSPNYQPNWVEADGYFISEDPIAGEHTQSKAFVVPADANNYAVIIYPVDAQQPLTLKLKEFKVDVDPAFIGYAIKAPELVGESHLTESEKFKQLTQDQQGYASLRYTIINAPTPMPVGILGKGSAAVSLDPSINQINNSGARGGEGAIRFDAEGSVKIDTTFKVYAGESVPAGQKRNVQFWFSIVNQNGTLSKIDGSDVEVQVTGGSKIPLTVPTSFDLDVKNGDRIVCLAQSDISDGAYIQADYTTKFCVKTNIDFKELEPGLYDEQDLVSSPIQKALVVDRRVYEFSNNTQQNILITNLDIPDDVELAEVEAVVKNGNVVTSLEHAEYSYNTSTNVLTVHVGANAAQGKIYLTFWS